MSGPLIVSDKPIAQFFTENFVDATLLTANERAIVANAVPKRQRDFSTGRYCAKQALKEFGLTHTEILQAEGKEPIWPDGFTGSISHTEGLCGAVIGRINDFKAIGLDIEKSKGVKKEMWDMVCSPYEQQLLNTVFKNDQGFYATLLFSIKESFYKLQYPLTKQFLEFTDVEVRWDGDNFKLAVLKPNYDLQNIAHLHIQWQAHGDMIISFCYIPEE